MSLRATATEMENWRNVRMRGQVRAMKSHKIFSFLPLNFLWQSRLETYKDEFRFEHYLYMD